jgi:hypothetical protein
MAVLGPGGAAGGRLLRMAVLGPGGAAGGRLLRERLRRALGATGGMVRVAIASAGLPTMEGDWRGVGVGGWCREEEGRVLEGVVVPQRDGRG